MPLRVLITEDDFLISMELAQIIEELGYEVCGQATDAQRAIEKAGQNSPDVVLMDVRLARGTSGVEAAAEILRSHNIRSLFISGNIDQAFIERTSSLRPIGYLNKPVDKDRLRNILRQVANCSDT